MTATYFPTATPTEAFSRWRATAWQTAFLPLQQARVARGPRTGPAATGIISSLMSSISIAERLRALYEIISLHCPAHVDVGALPTLPG